MSILTSIGQGDRFFEEKLKRWGINPELVEKNKKGGLDYKGSITISSPRIKEIPIKFDTVWGDFYVIYCINIESLKNSPTEVKGRFSLNGCDKIKNLIGGPKRATTYTCDDCDDLESLEGAPIEVDIFSCVRSELNVKNRKIFTDDDVRERVKVNVELHTGTVYDILTHEYDIIKHHSNLMEERKTEQLLTNIELGLKK